MDDVIVHYGVKGMKWGVRKKARNAARAIRDRLNEEPYARAVAEAAKGSISVEAQRAADRSARYAKKAAKLQGQASRLKKKEARYAKKELKATRRGNIKGQHVYKRKQVVSMVKAQKKAARAAKFSAKAQDKYAESLRLKARDVDQKTKDLGRRQIDKIAEASSMQ